MNPRIFSEIFFIWFKDGKQNSFAFMLVEAGFDVYLANSRGNRYSREHVILKPNEPEFWKWSWQEMAKYDLPATIDIVLETSKKKNLYYIGHSQGRCTLKLHHTPLSVKCPGVLSLKCLFRHTNDVYPSF